MIIEKPFDYKPLSRQEENGLRKYNTPDGKKLVSVTTILAALKDSTHLDAWRLKVGDLEAERIKNEASSIGSAMHANLENYVFDKPMSGIVISQILAKLIIKHGLSNVNSIWGSEIAVYSEGLYAGTTDLIGVHRGTPAIIDFKNSIREKKREWIEDYFLQLAAYAIAHNEMFGTSINKGVIMIATRDATYQEFIIEGEEFTKYEIMWANKVCQYYDKFGFE